MTVKSSLFLVLCLAASSPVLTAQQNSPADSTLVEYIQNTKSGGTVRIYQPAGLNQALGRHGSGKNLQHINNIPYLVTPGFRIQVFSGNNQRKSKTEAFSKENMVKELNPELETYVTFNSPFWRLRVGNFRSYEEADQVMRELKKGLPGFGKQMYIVREEVRFPLYNNIEDNE